MNKIMLVGIVSAVALLPGAAFAQQGTTLAGPAQGTKANGAASTRPAGAGPGRDAATPAMGSTAGSTGGATAGGAMRSGGTAAGTVR